MLVLRRHHGFFLEADGVCELHATVAVLSAQVHHI